MILEIKDFNPFMDGINDDSKLINELIEKINQNGGGKLIINDGFYSASLINILSNVELYLSDKAIIRLHENLENCKLNEINQPIYENCEYNGMPNKFFIYSKNQKNIKITGNGKIDGFEEIFYNTINIHQIDGKFYPRVPLIFFENIENYEISNVTLQNSAFWTVHLVGCKNGLIDHITINNNMIMVNSDGIDPDHCQNLIIKDSFIKAADDCIVLKTTEANKLYKDTSNIYVSNCILQSTSAAIKFGTESVCDFHDIEFKNIKILNSNRGISLQLRDEGNIRNVKFENIYIETSRKSPIYWWGKAEGIAITAVPRKNKVGSIKDIYFNNIQIDSENGILLYGLDNIDNINLKNIELKISKKTDYINDTIDLRPSIYNMIEGKTFILYKKGVKNINSKNFKYKLLNIDDYIEID